MSERKLFLGRLNHIKERDIEDVVRKYGKVVELDFKQNYAFVEYEKKEDCDKAYS